MSERHLRGVVDLLQAFGARKSIRGVFIRLQQAQRRQVLRILQYFVIQKLQGLRVTLIRDGGSLDECRFPISIVLETFAVLFLYLIHDVTQHFDLLLACVGLGLGEKVLIRRLGCIEYLFEVFAA